MKTDSIFYRLFQTFPRIFFELIGQQNVDVTAYQFASVELKQTAFRIDGVFVPLPEARDRIVYFVEVQFQPDLTFYRRFFSEIFLYLRQNESVNLWRAAVVYPSRNVESRETVPYEVLLASSQVQRIYLDELGEAGERSLGLKIVRLIVEREETAITSARELISQTRQTVTDEATRREILELIETVLLYKFTRLTREELQAMILTESEFKQTRMYQSIRQEGLEEGKLRAKLESVPRLLALGLSLEQVATALDLSVEQVQQASQNPS